MDVSEAGLLDLIADEGEVLRAYRDLAGVWTIGVGLTAASGVVRPKAGMTITRTQSRTLLRQALDRNYEPDVEAMLPGVPQHVFDPATSFHFNTGAIRKASWVGYYLAGRMDQAEAAFRAWNRAGGRIVRGLQQRREREWETLTTGRYHTVGDTPDEAAERAVLKRGDRGADVSELQRLLTAAGWVVATDGRFGPETERQVRAFQTAHPQLAVDGRAGPATMTALQRTVDARKKAATDPGTVGSAAGGAGGIGAGAGGYADTTSGALGWGLAIGLVVAALVLAWVAWRYRDELRAAARRMTS